MSFFMHGFRPRAAATGESSLFSELLEGVKRLKPLVREHSPQLYRLYERLNGLRYEVQLRYLVRQQRLIAQRLIAQHGANVLHGPFAGMRYILDSTGSVLSPKLIGSYEIELAPAIERVTAGGYEHLLDIGCAEGYYAVGLARSCPAATVFAYDINEQALALCRKLAELNGVKNIEYHGACDHEELRRHAAHRTFVLSDCEGAERVLLDPASCPELLAYDFLVELHDNEDPTISTTLVERFSRTHDCELIPQGTVELACYPELGSLPASEQQLAVQEFRPPELQWGYFRVRA